MKTLVVSFVIWIFVVPVAVAVFFIFMFLAAHSPDLYFTVTPLGLAFSILTIVWGPFWLEPFSKSQFPVVPKVSATHKLNSGEKI